MDSEFSRTSSNLDSDDCSIFVRRIKNGEVGAFREFFFLMQPAIYRFLYRYLSNQDIAKDLTQETFIKFWMHREQIDPSLFPKSYLYKIARNLALNHKARNHSISESRKNKNKYLTIFFNPEEEYDKLFLMDDLQHAVDSLPDRCRATFILSKFEGFEYSEIAEILDVSLQTVKNQMNKAISILKKLLFSYLN